MGKRFVKPVRFGLSGEGAWGWDVGTLMPHSSASVDFRVELTSPTRRFSEGFCWAQPRAGAIPPHAPGNPTSLPAVVMTLQPLELQGSDLFHGLEQMRTDDLGATWSAAEVMPGFERRSVGPSREFGICDFTPRWHAGTQRLLGTGHTVIFEEGHVAKVRPRHTAYAWYDAEARCWSAPKLLEMPDHPRFGNAGAGCTQRWDLPNGDILLPIYHKVPEEACYFATIFRCRFDGETLRIVEKGDELTIPEPRGFNEPSLTEFQGRYYLTLRNNVRGHVAVSEDGLHFSQPTPWLWEDGTELGSYNTQQHWVRHADALFLAYTRRGADNDHVIRHRAPLFIARVNPETLRVIRETERELMPNRGARLGNFAVTEVSPQETWVTDVEWMQPAGCDKYGADGSVWVSKIHWASPNHGFV